MRHAFLAAAVVANLGCATVFNSSHTQLDVLSHPGAEVTLDGLPAGRSPVSLELSTHGDHLVTIGDPRHPAAVCTMEAHLGIGWVLFDIITTAGFGLIVDAITGDWRSVDTADCGSAR